MDAWMDGSFSNANRKPTWTKIAGGMDDTWMQELLINGIDGLMTGCLKECCGAAGCREADRIRRTSPLARLRRRAKSDCMRIPAKAF